MPSDPNILLILTDDQRFDTIAALGNPHVHTPSLDRLMARGTTFTRCHIMGGTVGAVCCPSRAMLHTGRNLFSLEAHGEFIPDDHTTIGEHFRAHGYAAYHTGKWHNGTTGFARSFTGGDSIFFGGMADHWNVPCQRFDPEGRYQASPVIQKGNHSTILCTQSAVDLLRQHDRKVPFFLSVAYLAPHDPRTMPQEFLDRQMEAPPPLPENFLKEHPFVKGDLSIRDELLADLPRLPDQVRRHLAEYYAMIDHLDYNIGRLLDELDRQGLTEDTLIVFSGDNGLAVGQHGLMGKQNCYDHSVRVPLILAGPGVPRGARRDQFCYLHDVFPTLCEATGTGIPDSVESRSLWETIRADSPHRESIFCAYRHWDRSLTLDDGWKLIRSRDVHGSVHELLFDLSTDPHELTNRADDPSCREVLDDLRERLAEAQAAVGDQLFESP